MDDAILPSFNSHYHLIMMTYLLNGNALPCNINDIPLSFEMPYHVSKITYLLNLFHITFKKFDIPP